ncbi:4-(cytidine 5'-diphospho)-2-C-methyl-D-erythritol kinase [Sediminicoccus rosea]|jgi:4-diphosphocytidyl-2-C-methyl-D-erythritol kinase|uniref:4-diphosphocytidyl-2-C-methyl-D-erythritol kinase n=1 Tax=Sediminicoccus rosea TaxID=1225128 RepID=A0ABZ0PHD6_9PROT|nr:4-(cytidine 5'-diphospho)-2-C-methyl-D-erythritol kinase [Sediminicoccus rosea]WPB84696.1 4-(cytidine 5'-diphospho)-2-C-methyl-D-erythritol kinase [Sediminicoccus rosea]
MTTLEEAAPAKVNLFLHVTGRRADGYHLLDSLAVFGPAADRLAAAPADQLSLTLAGPFGESLAAEPDNLVLRAARTLAAEAGVTAGAALRLEKHLPVASGIGGGSADAAAALRLLNRLWGCALEETVLTRLAAPLGADIPVCVASRPARMQGIGEQISPGPTLPECGLLLVNPRVPVATPAVFRARQGGFSPSATLPGAWGSAAAMAADLARLTNDLEAPALSLCPVIGEVLAALRAAPGCLLARMSGSGATCFGIFATPAEAAAAARGMPPAWWAAGGALIT